MKTKTLKQKTILNSEINLEDWKEWTLEHDITPSSKSGHEYERKLAQAMERTLKVMRKNPEMYKAMLEEYDSIYAHEHRSNGGEVRVGQIE